MTTRVATRTSTPFLLTTMPRGRECLVTVWLVTLSGLGLASGLTVLDSQRYTGTQGVRYVVGVSRTLHCPKARSCTPLFCAKQCALEPGECRSYSVSRVVGQCVLTPWYVMDNATVPQSDWSTYETRWKDCDSSPCQNGGSCQDEVSGGFTCSCLPGYSGDTCQTPARPAHCKEALASGQTSGVLSIYPDGSSPLSVYCDMDTDGGGWVVFQRRQDGSVNFDLSLQDFKDGFGSLTGEFWLGLDNIRSLTSRWTHELRVDMRDSSVSKWAAYSAFSLAPTTYSLSYGAFTGGTAGDCLTYQKGYAFTTPPPGDTSFCQPLWYGGWWYANSCMYCNLNGRYGDTNGGGVKWHPFAFSLQGSEMKIRPSG